MVKNYYDSNDIGDKTGLPGTGIVGIILGALGLIFVIGGLAASE